MVRATVISSSNYNCRPLIEVWPLYLGSQLSLRKGHCGERRKKGMSFCQPDYLICPGPHTHLPTRKLGSWGVHYAVFALIFSTHKLFKSMVAVLFIRVCNTSQVLYRDFVLIPTSSPFQSSSEDGRSRISRQAPRQCVWSWGRKVLLYSPSQRSSFPSPESWGHQAPCRPHTIIFLPLPFNSHLTTVDFSGSLTSQL